MGKLNISGYRAVVIVVCVTNFKNKECRKEFKTQGEYTKSNCCGNEQIGMTIK